MYVCQLQHPTTGEVLVDVPALKVVLDNRIGHGLERYAYIIHDRDTVTDDDVKTRDAIREQYITTLLAALKHDDLQTSSADSEVLAAVDRIYPRLVVGEQKPRHIHLVLRLSCRRYLSEILSWFTGVLNNVPYLFKRYSDVRGQSLRELNALRYLIHAAHPAKYQYNSQDVVASFDYANEIAAISILAKEREKYDMRMEDIMDYINQIVAGKKTRADYIKEHSYAMYIKDQTKIDRAELQRIKTRTAQMRVSGYIGSSNPSVGGLGKSLLNRILAVCIAVRRYGLDLKEWATFESLKTSSAYIHSASSAGLFEAYDAQPILCASDFTADTVKASFRDGLAAVKDFFDPHPCPTVRHVKGSVIVPACDYVVIDGQQDWREFFKSICRTFGMSEDEAKRQVSQLARRWFWYIDVKDRGVFDVYLNRLYYHVEGSQNDLMVDMLHGQYDYISVLNSSLEPSERLSRVITDMMPVADLILSYHEELTPAELLEAPVFSQRANSNIFKSLCFEKKNMS